MRLDVAGAARVAVVVPGPADRLAFVDDDKVLEAGLLESDAHAQAAGTRTNNRDSQFLLHVV